MKNKNKIMSRFELLRTLLAVGIAVVFAVVIIFLVSSQPLEAIYKFFVAPLTSFRYIANIIELMTPLLFTGLAVTFILQTKVYNLAVEGMVYAGGLAAALAATLLKMGPGIHAFTALFAGLAAGALIAFLPAILKLKFEANEIVSSLMLNYITFYIGDFLLKTYMKDPKSTHVASLNFAKTARLFEFTRGIHFGLVIAVVLVIAAWALYLYMFAHPGKKLNFMGNEFGQLREWDEKRQQDWEILRYPVHDAFHRFMMDLNKLYSENPALYEMDYDPEGLIKLYLVKPDLRRLRAHFHQIVPDLLAVGIDPGQPLIVAVKAAIRVL